MRNDHVTNTPEDAARFERMYGDEGWDDRPDWSDVCDDDGEVLDVDESDGYVHPPWCSLPPFHGPCG